MTDCFQVEGSSCPVFTQGRADSGAWVRGNKHTSLISPLERTTKPEQKTLHGYWKTQRMWATKDRKPRNPKHNQTSSRSNGAGNPEEMLDRGGGRGVVKLDRGGGQGMTDNSALARGTHKESANIGCSGNLCWVICLRFCLSLIALDPGDTHKHTHTHMGGGTRDRDRQRQTWRYTIYRKLIRNIFIWVDFLRVKRNIKLNTYRKII